MRVSYRRVVGFLQPCALLERWGAVVLAIVALVATSRIIHVSIATGMMGMMFSIYAIPFLSLAFVVWAVATRRLSDGLRRATMVATILLACGVWALLRTNGITGDAASDFAWRWAKTAEERLLAHREGRRLGAPSGSSGASPGSGHPGGSGSSQDGSRLARLSRTPSRRHHPRRADRDRLVSRRRRSSCGAGRSDRAGRPSRSAAISSTPRSSAVSDEVVACYNADHRRAGVDTPRRGPVLGVECRRRSARDAHPRQRSRIHIRRDRNPERARRRVTAPSCGRATRRPTPARRSPAGASRARRWWSTTSSSSPPPAGSPPTTSPPANRAGSARTAAMATARRIY